jgi:two-component system sensor histidine kinase BaeS
MDRDRTMQALANLVENAIRVTAEGGSVTLGAKALDENLVALSVADTGTGLAPEVVQHLFDRFWQGEGKGGSGLGLAIVRGVAEAHGGEVRVDSELGVGSTFHLVLPRA